MVRNSKPSQPVLHRTYRCSARALAREAGVTAGYYGPVMSSQLAIDRDAIKAFCERHHIARLALFGSVLRDDFDADSDVDVLVEFQPGHVPGLKFVSMERELSELLQGVALN